MGEMSNEIWIWVEEIKKELLAKDESDLKSDQHQESNSVCLKEYGISYIWDILIDALAYCIMGFILSFIVGSFYSGMLTFILMLYLKYITNSQTPFVNELSKFITRPKT